MHTTTGNSAPIFAGSRPCNIIEFPRSFGEYWRVTVMMSFVRVLSNSSSKAAGCACVRPHSAEGRRGFRLLPCLFFSCRPRVRLGHRDLANNFLRAVAEACSPQRFREENAVVRFMIYLTLLSLATCMRLYSSIPRRV